MKNSFIFLAIILILSGCNNPQEDTYPEKPAAEILQSFVEDFCLDPTAGEPVSFGVRVRGEGGGDWHIEVKGKVEGEDKVQVTLHQGFPAEPIGYYNMDISTLNKVYREDVTILTSMGKARASDIAPVEFDVTEGFTPGAEYWERLSLLTFHFWTRGQPEIVKFDKKYSRIVHGGNVVLFYYQRGLRSAWFQIEKGQHINEDPKDQINPFPSMFIITRGKAESKIGGLQQTIEAGEMLFVPKGITHEFWNPNDKPCEFILIMFGEGA